MKSTSLFKIFWIGFIFLVVILVIASYLFLPKHKNIVTPEPQISKIDNIDKKSSRESLIEKYQNIVPKLWGENLPGVKTKLDTNQKVLALTFDACGGSGGNGFDKKLIEYLVQKNIPATLFINSRWVDENKENFQYLVNHQNLFELENHGTKHVPCSVKGQSAYGITGTKNVGELLDEILLDDSKLTSLTGKKPKFFRPGTAYTDEVCPQIANDLGYQVVGYNVLGDAGATYSATQIEKALLGAESGSIVIMHMNHPEKETANGVINTLPKLEAQGFSFVKLEDFKLK